MTAHSFLKYSFNFLNWLIHLPFLNTEASLSLITWNDIFFEISIPSLPSPYCSNYHRHTFLKKPFFYLSSHWLTHSITVIFSTTNFIKTFLHYNLFHNSHQSLQNNFTHFPFPHFLKNHTTTHSPQLQRWCWNFILRRAAPL